MGIKLKPLRAFASYISYNLGESLVKGVPDERCRGFTFPDPRLEILRI